MNVSIGLDSPHTAYTNLDILSGKVYLRVPNTTNVSSIIVKLEGESKTRLTAPVARPGFNDRARPGYNDRARPVLEVHKSAEQAQASNFSIQAGSYEYPFQFKLPFNNACNSANSLSTNLSISGLALEVARQPTRHVKQTLPPSITGFPGEAEIRYYVKVTVNRPSFLKENPRAGTIRLRSFTPRKSTSLSFWSANMRAQFTNFNFLPIEPPRPERADGESYARRQHQFIPSVTGPADGPKDRRWFGRKQSTEKAVLESPNADSSTKVPPRFSVDARLPNPAILTCNEDVPIRIIVKQLSERSELLFLQSLHVELVGYTKVLAHEVARMETNSWVIVSMSNMAIPLGAVSDAVGAETLINREYWSGKALPNTIAPTFQTCNLSRHYELEVRVGLGYGSHQHGKDQLIVLPLRMPVKVYSGIAPPAELLKAMKLGYNSSTSSYTPTKPDLSVPPTPMQPPSPSAYQFPPQQGSYQPPPGPSGPSGPAQSAPGYEEEPPPSYEDAVAQDLPPVDGGRRNYMPPPASPGDSDFAIDHKR